jgi:hypothetical protein
MRIYQRRIFRSCAALLLFIAVFSCNRSQRPSLSVKREQLFSLGYGQTEDQLNLFQLAGQDSPQKTRIAMREGIFYIADGAGYKVVRMSSYGSLLSMIYNTEQNPEPVILKRAEPNSSEVDAAARKAFPYPFRSIGEIAVASDQTVYIEDRLPPERRISDKDTGTMFDRVILRFNKEGRYSDFLGQEGLGGTPFPYILGVYVVSQDDCVVVSMTQSAYLVHWFDSNGLLIGSVKLSRDELPRPDKGGDLIASLDKIVPDINGRFVIYKIDYYRETIDPATKTSSGIDFASSWVYRMNLRDGSFTDRWMIPATEVVVKDGENGHTVKYARVPELLGAAGNALVFISADDDGSTTVTTFDRATRDTTRYLIDIAPDELLFNTYFLSKEGILCALLASRYEARIVWWRFDKILSGIGQGLTS